MAFSRAVGMPSISQTNSNTSHIISVSPILSLYLGISYCQLSNFTVFLLRFQFVETKRKALAVPTESHNTYGSMRRD